MMHTYDVVALGELLIDFTSSGVSAQGNPMLEANPGGAPCNVLALLAKMGRKPAFIGKVGDDAFGTQLENALLETGISTEGLRKDPRIHTTLAVVQTMADGDRDFSFYRNPGADLMLTEDELDADMIQNAKIFHFGSLSLTDEPARTATRKAIALAEDNSIIGIIELLKFDEEAGTCSFAYMIGDEFWGRGYGTQALKAALDFGFEQMELNAVEADHMAANPASGAVMRKAGMTYLRTDEGKYQKNGCIYDATVYRITRNQWENRIS